MVCLSGTRVESRIVSPGHSKSGGKVVKQSPVATLTQRRTTPFDVSSITYFMTAFSPIVEVKTINSELNGASYSPLSLHYLDLSGLKSQVLKPTFLA